MYCNDQFSHKKSPKHVFSFAFIFVWEMSHNEKNSVQIVTDLLCSRNDALLTVDLKKLSSEWDKKFDFDDLDVDDKQKLREALVRRISRSDQNDDALIPCLELAKILSRDKTPDTKTSHWPDRFFMKILLHHAGLLEPINFGSTSNYRVISEAQQCLCNFLFQMANARQIFCDEKCVQSLYNRLKQNWDCSANSDRQVLLLNDLRLFFLITALCEKTHKQCRQVDCNVPFELTLLLFNAVKFYGDNGTSELSEEQTASETTVGASGSPAPPLAVKQASSHLTPISHSDGLIDLIVFESLKVLFNVMMGCKMDKTLNDDQKRTIKQLVCVLRHLLLHKQSFGKPEELRSPSILSHVVNLLTILPSESYQVLTPCRSPSGARNFEAVDILLDFLECRLNAPANDQKVMLSPILTLLTYMAISHKFLRKYLKLKILPPLTDVTHKPEEGCTMRNKLVKLMTSVSDISLLDAQFLFQLCNCNVGRLIKYTGFGNAAGMLAYRGLLSGGVQKPEVDEDSENSDTEEYLNALSSISPILGCREPEPSRPSPMDGMSEEQKEVEAMRLVDEINKMMQKGVIKPGRVGEDGKIHPIEHVLQLQEAEIKKPH